MMQWPAHFTLCGLWLQSESEAWCSDQHTLHYMVFDCKVRVKHGAVTSTLYIRWSLTARWECSTVQWPAHLTLRGLWLQGESAAWCSDNHNLHAVSDCKVRVQHVAVNSTFYITCGLWLQGESAGQCSDQHTLHGVFDCKVRMQHGAVTSTLYITWSLTVRWECSMVQWPAHLTLHVVFDCKVRSAVWCCDWQYYPVKSRAWWPAHGVSILVMSSTDSGSDQQLSHQSCSVVSQGSLKPAIRCFTRISKACI